MTDNLKDLRAKVDRLYALALEAQRKAQAALRRYHEAMVEQYGTPQGMQHSTDRE